MRIGSVLKPFCLVAAIAVLSGCGAEPPAPLAKRTAGHVGVKALEARLEGPVTAKAALAYAHAVARQLDGKAYFMSLSGTRIGADGAPARGGRWQAAYIGDVVEPPAGVPSNPYNRYQRRILVTIDAEAEATVAVSEEAGMPLGVQLLDAPMPALDSQAAIKAAQAHQGGGYRGPVAKMVFCGQVTPRHSRLLWRVTTTTQSGDKLIALDADTGAVVPR